ncbi:coiled-coil domain-containing protein 112-like [Lycorma delicatula]|uniref:coiled-coil domain-containing protein 112-like n=1 Tax=Lycorma delicatula TaxID=130591 RepID=UPI003F5149EF
MDNRRRERISCAVAFLCGTNKLKSEQRLLEKMQEKLISNLKSFSVQERNELLDYARALEANTNRDVAEMQDELFNVFDLIKEVTREINDPEKLKQHDISYFRSKMSELEKRIYNLQGNCTRELKKLHDEEITLMSELDMTEEKIEEISDGRVFSALLRAQSSSKIKCNCSSDDLTPEVNNFRKFVDKTGGHYGGWSENDHLHYLQLRKKHNAASTASLLHQKFSDHKIVLTIDTYVPRRTDVSLIHLYQVILGTNHSCYHLEQRRAFVNEYKLQKLTCEQALEIARQVEEEKRKQQTASRANAMLKVFRDEDMKYALKLRERLQQQQNKKNGRKSSSSSESSIKISRDPERLLKPTEVWRLKTTKKDDDTIEVSKPLLHLRNMPRLRIPKWRQGLTSDS